jgi:hypothetical protein
MRIVSVQGNNVYNCIRYAQRLLGLSREDAKHADGSVSGEDSLYRATFPNGDVAEITVITKTPCSGELLES